MGKLKMRVFPVVLNRKTLNVNCQPPINDRVDNNNEQAIAEKELGQEIPVEDRNSELSLSIH